MAEHPGGSTAPRIQTTWSAFRDRLADFARLPADRRSDFLFHGQSSATCALESTLDRYRSFNDDPSRLQFVDGLLAAFSVEMIRRCDESQQIPDGQALDLLARHYQLPLNLIDVTESPWIAAYFAFREARPNTSHVAI